MNKVILMGRLTRDVEMRQTTSGVNLARFTIAVNRRFASRDPQQQQADFINCVAWRQTGEFIARYFGKGSMIAVEGRIQTRTWDDQEGKRQYSTKVVVDEAYFTGSKAETNTGERSLNYGGGYQNNGYQNNGGYQNAGYQNAGYTAPQTPAPSSAPSSTEPNFDEFDTSGFEDFDGSEDDLPF